MFSLPIRESLRAANYDPLAKSATNMRFVIRPSQARNIIQETIYRNHRRMLKKMTPRIDMKPPVIMMGAFYRPKLYSADYRALRRIIRDNIRLLIKLNKIQRKTGLTTNHNTRKFVNISRLHLAAERLDKIEKQNFYLGCKLLTLKGRYNFKSWRDYMSRERRKQLQLLTQSTFKRFSLIVNPRENYHINKYLRPRIYFDFAIRNIRPLGRIAIQLYTEACPEVVLEIVRSATFKRKELLKIVRVFPYLWIEAELSIKNESLHKRGFHYDWDILDHGYGAGIVSFNGQYLNGFPKDLLSFTISLRPIPLLNEKRIAFGLVISGLRVIDAIQVYGTKNGKTKGDIICVNTGLISQ